MRILLDLQVLQTGSRVRGIGRYSRGLAAALLGDFGEEASVLLNLSLGDDTGFDQAQRWVREHARPGNLHLFRGLNQVCGRNPDNDPNRRAGALCYDAYVATRGVDIVHIASPFEGFTDDTAVGWGELSGVATAATLYDLIPFQQPDVHLDNVVRRGWFDQRFRELARADVLLAISEETRRIALEMLNLAPDRVVNIGADCDPEFRKVELQPEQQSKLLSHYGLSKPFIIHVGAAEPRKNVATLIRAFSELSPALRNGHQLFLAGEMTDLQQREIARELRKARLDSSSVILQGFVPDEDLIALYGLARVAVMPSFLEGFGLPLLEAMRCGSPVLGANCSSLPEVVGTSDLLFNPRQPASLAEKLTLMLSDDGFRAHALAHCDAQQKRFSWHQSASIAHEAFASACARRRAEAGVTNDSARRYVLILPSEYAVDSDLSDSITQLRQAGDVSIARPLDKPSLPASESDVPVVDPAAIGVSGDQRVIIVGDLGGLDDVQQAALATTPAVLLSEGGRQQPATTELKYRLSGYPALLPAHDAPVMERPGLGGYSYPNLIATFDSDADLAERIEAAYRSHPLGIVPALLDQLRSIDGFDPMEVASAIAENQSAPIAPRLLVDLSSLVRHDAGSGVQRVVKAILRHLLNETHEWRVEPIYRDGDTYRYARKFSCQFLNVDPGDLTDAVVDFHATDTFLGLDLDAELSEAAANNLRYHRRRGMRVIFIIYDLLPIVRSDWFEPYMGQVMTFWFHRILSFADQLIAISQSVANEITAFIDRLPKKPAHRPVVSWWHLGSDYMATAAGRSAFKELDENSARNLAGLEGRTVFLTVGTIEPRKGIGQLMESVEEFLRTDDASFVIVGKKGWMVDSLVEQLRAHPEFDKRLIWFDHPTDAVLERLYDLATAALLPSQGEGFGLPLVEAARHNTPVIARDIPVFREVGGDNAHYFKAQSGRELSAALREWLALNQRGEAPTPMVKVATWHESAEQLLDVVRRNAPVDCAASRHEMAELPEA